MVRWRLRPRPSRSVAPLAASALQRMRSVGMEPGTVVVVLLWTIAIGVGLSVGVVTMAAIAYAPRVARRILVWGAWGLTLLLPVCLWPMARFFATDWKWGLFDGPTAAAPANAPNVLLVTIDTLRADHLGSYGSDADLTPNLDRLATSGVVFRSAITSSPWTLPATAAILTGLEPRHHGAGRVTNRHDPLGRSPLADDSATLAGTLAAAGWRTHAIVTNPYLTVRYGLASGFHTYENVTVQSELFIGSQHTTAMRLLTWLRPELVVGDRGTTVSERATAWMERAPGDRPFLLWLHYVDPHAPYSKPGVVRHKSFRGDSLLTGEGDVDHDTSPDVARLRSGEIRLDAKGKDLVRSLYAAEVATVDATVGGVLASLDRLGLRDRTLVVVVADHGEELWEHGGVEHGHTVYDELVRVPLILSWPGHLEPGAVDAVVGVTDVVPTVLDLLGLTAPGPLDGQTLRPFVEGDATDPPDTRAILVENMLFGEERLGVRSRKWKFVQWGSGRLEAYDLERDPAEQIDLAGVPAVRADLEATLAGVVGGPSAAAKAEAPAVDPATRDALRSLGYVR
jgi:arylsulfatase A-like enzyme